MFEAASACDSCVTSAGVISFAQFGGQAASDARRKRVHVDIRDPLFSRALEQLEDLGASKLNRRACDDVYVNMFEPLELGQEHDVCLRDSELGLKCSRACGHQMPEDGCFGRGQLAQRAGMPAQHQYKPPETCGIECVRYAPEAIIVDPFAWRQREIGVALARKAAAGGH